MWQIVDKWGGPGNHGPCKFPRDVFPAWYELDCILSFTDHDTFLSCPFYRNNSSFFQNLLRSEIWIMFREKYHQNDVQPNVSCSNPDSVLIRYAHCMFKMESFDRLTIPPRPVRHDILHRLFRCLAHRCSIGLLFLSISDLFHIVSLKAMRLPH
jgi:hypothetical protein